MRLHRSGALVWLVAFVAAGCSGSDGDKAALSPAPKASVSADALDDQFVRVVRTVSPSVVQIETVSGLGSGIVYDGDGHIVTNAHVVGDARKFTVTLSGGDRHAATLVGTFRANDLAVIRLEDARPPAATFADSSKVEVGEFALAIGNPLGLRSSVTEGIVSSLGRTVSEGNRVVLPSVIQTSAPINPGNSGGALVDIQGRVIGIPTLAALVPELGGSEAPGIGFAIPSNTARKVADQLIEHGRVLHSGRGFLGGAREHDRWGRRPRERRGARRPGRQGRDSPRRHHRERRRPADADGRCARLRPRQPETRRQGPGQDPPPGRPPHHLDGDSRRSFAETERPPLGRLAFGATRSSAGEPLSLDALKTTG